MNQTSLAKCQDASEDLFESIYDRLYAKAMAANEALYQESLRRCKSRKQREKCAGQYISSWQQLLNDWCKNNVPNIFVLQWLDQENLNLPQYQNKIIQARPLRSKKIKS